jgi:hypothetical protein
MNDSSRQAGANQGGYGSSKEVSKALQDFLYHTDLLVKRSQDVLSRNWERASENYADGKLMIYLVLTYLGTKGEQHDFPFLIGKDVLELGWPNGHEVEEDRATPPRHRKAMPKMRLDPHQVFPMLIFVGDLVHRPEDVISSGVWSLGFDEGPLIGSEFLFQSVLPGHPRIWEWIRLPSVAVDAPEWVPYARRATAIKLDEGDSGFVERNAKTLDDFDNIESDVPWDAFVAACNYMRDIRFSMDSYRVGVGLKEPVNRRLKVTKLALSSFDIFT